MWLINMYISVLVHLTLYAFSGGIILIFLGGVHILAVAIQSRRTIEEVDSDSDDDDSDDDFTTNIKYTDYSDIIPLRGTTIPVIQGEISYAFGFMFIKTGLYSIVTGLGAIGILRLISLVYTYENVQW